MVEHATKALLPTCSTVCVLPALLECNARLTSMNVLHLHAAMLAHVCRMHRVLDSIAIVLLARLVWFVKVTSTSVHPAHVLTVARVIKDLR